MMNIQYNSGAIDASGAVSQGWELIKKNYWMYFGIALLAYVMIACIPIANIFLMGPVLVGIYYVMLREMRGEPVEFGMMFKGFEKFVPAMVVGLIQSIPGIIMQIVQFSMNIGSNLLTQPGRSGRRGEPDLDVLMTFLGAYMVVIGGLMLFSFVWHALFIFALPLIAEHDNIGPLDAIKYSFKAAFSNIGGLIVLIIFEILIGILGVIALCIGIFFVMPLFYAIAIVAYRQVFPPPAFIPQNNAPPTPDQYGGSYGQGM
jgi:uncharacterized membrane protein